MSINDLKGEIINVLEHALNLSEFANDSAYAFEHGLRSNQAEADAAINKIESRIEALIEKLCNL